MGRRIAGLVAVALLAAGCATSGKATGGPGSSVQLDVPANVAWEVDGPYEVPLTVFNATRMTLFLVRPTPEATEIIVYGPDDKVVCRTARPERAAVEGWNVRKVGSLTGVNYRVDLQRDCRSIASGKYRYEATYVARAATNIQDHVWAGSLGPQGGRVLVGSGVTKLRFDELAAALDGKEPEPATGTATATTPAPDAAPAAAGDASAVRTCVDRELAARGLNAYGDTAGTSYPGGPPTDEFGRVLYVASRSPAIRHACGITGF